MKRKKVKYLLSFFLLVIVTTSMTVPVNAYELLGFKWANSQVDDLTYERTGSSSVNEIWNDAIYTWNNQSILPNFDSQSSVNPDVEFQGVHLENTDADGKAEIYADPSGTAYHAYSWINTFYTQNYSNEKARSVAAHEIGHVLGLEHETGCVLMNGSTNLRYDICGIFSPVQDDLNGINAIY